MEIRVERVWQGNLEEYKSALDKFNATYENEGSEFFATIEIADLNKLFSLAKELEEDLIISHYHYKKVETVTIYDDYIE